MSLERWFDQHIADAEPTLEYQCEMRFLEIAEEICIAMEMRGVTRTELAKRLKVTPQYVTKLLSGNENMTLVTLIKISRASGAGLSVGLSCFLPGSTGFQHMPSQEGAESEDDSSALAA